MDKQVLPGLRITFLVHAIACLVIGLGLLLIPNALAGLYSPDWLSKDPSVYRLFGAVTLAVGASSWLCYRERLWDRVRIVAEMELVICTMAVLASLLSLLNGGTPTANLVNVVYFAAFGIVFGYFTYRETAVVLKPQA